MRRFMMTIGSTAVVLGSSLIAAAQDKGPAQQAPAQAPMQAPAKAPMQAPMQAPSKAPMAAQAPQQKLAPVQAPDQKYVQAPSQKHMQGPTQSPVQKGPMAGSAYEAENYAMARPGTFRRIR
jgi:hypothetical protein